MTLFQRLRAAIGLIFNRYEGAEWSPSRSDLSIWGLDPRLDQTPETRETLLTKASHWDQSAALVQRICDLWEMRTVGAGITFNVVSDDEEWNDLAKRELQRWENGTDNRTKQKLFARYFLLLGEGMVLRTASARNLPRVQLLEPALCRTPPQYRNNENFRDGIELTGDGRFYWFETASVSGQSTWTRVDGTWVEHRLNHKRVNQIRGYSQFAPALNEVHDLRDLQMLEQQACRDILSVTHVVKNETGEASATAGLMRTRYATDASQTVDPQAEYNRYVKSVTGARTLFLKRGDQLDRHESRRPTNETREYWKTLTADVCAAANIPMELVYQEQMSGASIRLILQLANDAFYNGFLDMVPAWRRVARWVINSDINAGRLPAAPVDWDLEPVPPVGFSIDPPPEDDQMDEDEGTEIEMPETNGNGASDRLAMRL